MDSSYTAGPHPNPTSFSSWQVPAVPRGILEKAEWYVERQDTHIRIIKEGDGFAWYFLVKNNPLELQKITVKAWKVS